jgi:murein DD-endopeptidase MepM/ murein hydrolase activator NlpD|tara:strand:+ start:75215 stop:76495 length:1281 start_codon:yes stop_codon:yes gene_type:complete
MKWVPLIKLVCLCALIAFVNTNLPIYASEIDELESKIKDRNAKIQEIEREIDQYQKELVEVGKEKNSLEGAIRTLNVSRQRVSANIRLTETKISATSFDISELGVDITDKERRIIQNTKALGETIRRINEIESDTLVEALLGHDNLAEFWDQLETIQQFQTTMQSDLELLYGLKEDLEEQRGISVQKRNELRYLKGELSDEKHVLDINKQDKKELLDITENKESNYQKLLDEKVAAREAFERELFEFESQLRLAIDPSSIPPVGSGVLRWPLDSVFVTQYFGNTPFASQNPQVYSGSGHNGVDFRASPGTRVKSALTGTVVGTGDTDTVCRNASYGKWVLIKHNNGLSTLYAHLSGIKAVKGQSVNTGDVIGFSGNTGYSTGPHLHFAVYATQGVRIDNLKSRVCRGTYTIPLADLKAYLNPLSYL